MVSLRKDKQELPGAVYSLFSCSLHPFALLKSVAERLRVAVVNRSSEDRAEVDRQAGRQACSLTGSWGTGHLPAA